MDPLKCRDLMMLLSRETEYGSWLNNINIQGESEAEVVTEGEEVEVVELELGIATASSVERR